MENKPKSKNPIIRITGRLSYPRLFRPERVNKEDLKEPEKYGCTILMDKKTDAASIKAVQEAIKQVKLEKWKNEKPSNFRGACLRDGSEKSSTPGYGDKIMFTSATRNPEDGRPTVIDGQRNPLTAEDNKPYAGCYVNASIELWPQDNQHGRRVNATLRGVQFVKDGEPFGSGTPVDAESEFPDVADVENDLV